ncbi:hypothetical protein IJJ36_02905 [Candidatus Saccharibacteria bacterium]|nr:hypothetical protein [Candidatus Saccharibacteria bacterium]
MAQRRRRKNRRWLGKILFLMLIILAGVVCFFVWDGYFRDKGTDAPKETGNFSEEVVQTTEKETSEKTAEVIEKEEIKQYEGEDPNEANDLTGVVTYAGVVGDELVIRVNIDQYLASGSCELSLLQDGAVVYSDTVEIIDSASTATCAGFNVPVSSLNDGEIGIRIELDANGKKGMIAGEVRI